MASTTSAEITGLVDEPGRSRGESGSGEQKRKGIADQIAARSAADRVLCAGWNRDHFNGYRVVFVPFANGMPSGKAEDVVTGFLTDDGKARGRPVGLAVDRTGALLIADDVGNTVWRVTGSPQQVGAAGN